MNHVEKIREIAQKTGVEAYVGALLDRAQALCADESLPRVGILGSYGAGKTTLINAALDTQVREPQMIPEQGGKPLRVVFDRRDGDARFECVSVVNSPWAEAADALYEFDLPAPVETAEGMLPAEEDVDCWFFAVNALMPLTSSETQALKKLPPASVTLLITRTDSLRQGEILGRVTELVEAYCAHMGFGGPVLCDTRDGSELGKLLRRQLPDGEGLAALRREHAQSLIGQAEQTVRGAVDRALKENQQSRQEAEADLTRWDLQLQRKKAAWSAVRADVLESGTALAKEVEETLFSHQKELTQALYRSGQENTFSERWCQEGLPREMARQLRELKEPLGDQLLNRIDRDLTALLQKAEDLQIVPDPWLALGAGPAGMRGLDKKHRGKSPAYETAKLVALSVASMGGIILARSVLPISNALTVAATAAAAGAANRQYQNLKDAKANDWYDVLSRYVEQNLKELSRAIRESILDHYDQVARKISEQSALQKLEFDSAPFEARQVELEELLGQL